jgi:LDH2 family malate/lactate/ureidoglycolate dehydrogenase
MDIARFFMAIDPAIFRAARDFESDVATFLGALRGTVPVDPTQPVMVAGIRSGNWRRCDGRMAYRSVPD